MGQEAVRPLIGLFPKLEALGMYTGLTEPLDFDQTDGTERVEKLPMKQKVRRRVAPR